MTRWVHRLKEEKMQLAADDEGSRVQSRLLIPTRWLKNTEEQSRAVRGEMQQKGKDPLRVINPDSVMWARMYLALVVREASLFFDIIARSRDKLRYELGSILKAQENPTVRYEHENMALIGHAPSLLHVTNQYHENFI